MRYRQIILVFKFLYIVLILSLIYLQLIKGEVCYKLSIKNSIRGIPIEAARGRIFDRNGQILAQTSPLFQVSIIPYQQKDRDILYKRISQITGIPREIMQINFNKNYINPYRPTAILEGLTKDEIISLEENKIFLPGIIIDMVPKRVYPNGNLCSHVIGYLSAIDSYRLTKLQAYGYDLKDIVGYSGIEEYYDLFLRGEKGGMQIEVDNRGKQVRTVSYKPPLRGKDIQLTIDVRIQKIIDEMMEDRKGVVIVMNPYDGQIIALSSKPDYDPNIFLSSPDNIAELLKDKDSPLFNRAISGQYPPASIFKLVTALAALDTKQISSNTVFNCSGAIEIGNREFKCWSVHGEQNLEEAIVHSCDVYFYNLGLVIGPELLSKYAQKLGFGRKTKIDLGNESEGLIPSPTWKKITFFQKWYKGDTANFAIGQGDVLVTPLQIITFISIFANNGELVTPHLIKAVEDKSFFFKPVELNIKKEILDFIRLALYKTVNSEDGTASVLKVEGCKIAGKTGTAQAGSKPPHGWFAGYFGKDKPQFSICVLLENVGSSQFACLLAKRIILKMLEEGLI